MRYTNEIAALGLLGALASWYAQAPREPQARGLYLCAPVDTAVHLAARLEQALDDADRVIPPEHAWLPDLPHDCARIVQRWSAQDAVVPGPDRAGVAP